VAELSEWLKIMLGEVARKRDEQSQALNESQARSSDAHASATQPAGVTPAQGR
jgi:hypothetical protein